MTNTFITTHHGLVLSVEVVKFDRSNLRTIGHGRLLRMGAVGAAEIARRQAAVYNGLDRIAARAR